MDFLEKLNFLMEINRLNKHSLSKDCGIPYTTINGWYKKGYDGLALSTLKKLSSYFGTSLDYWAHDEIGKSEPEPEKVLINKYRLLNQDGKGKLLERADELFNLGYVEKGEAVKRA